MYSAIKDWEVIYTLDYEPTQEQLTDLNCDSYEVYVEVEAIETEEKKKYRIYQALISSPDIQSVDLEWIVFTNKEIGDIILDRVFWGNPHSQSALLAKTNAYLLSVISWEPDEELIDSIIEKQNKINEVRQKFNLKVI